MRLTDDQQRAIRDAARTRFGADVRVYVFGSRTDDHARGGDIDLFVEADRPIPNRVETAARFEADLIRALGERTIDIVVADPTVCEKPIHRAAREQGIELR